MNSRHSTEASNIMSSAMDDEKQLLEEITTSVGDWFFFYPEASENVYPFASYIIENVIGLRLDVPQMLSGGTVAKSEAKLNLTEIDYENVGIISMEIEQAGVGNEMDEHKLGLTLIKMLRKKQLASWPYTMNFVLLGPLGAYAVTHGIWLLVLRLKHSDSNPENILRVLKRVEGSFMTLRRQQGKQEADYDPDMSLYISLLSSTITKKPMDNWKSMRPLYDLVDTMLKVASEAYWFLKDFFLKVPSNLLSEFERLGLLSIYWVIRGVFACSYQCNNLQKNGYMIQDSQKLIYVNGILISIHKQLQKLRNDGKEFMDDKEVGYAWQIPNRDYGSALPALFGLNTREDLNSILARGGKNEEDSVSVFLLKSVFLLISGLEISFNEISFLTKTYATIKKSWPQFRGDCEILWIPIFTGTWTKSLDERFKELQQKMPWYTVRHPSFVKKETMMVIRDRWKFQRKPILVALNRESIVVCPNTIHMMHIWGANAFPFTRKRERGLWMAETSLASLVLGFDDSLVKKVESGKWIILYGGNDIELLERRFTIFMNLIASESDIPFQAIYLGRNAGSEEIRKVLSKLSQEPYKIGGSTESYQPDKTMSMIWYFWARLESILISRYQAYSSRSDHAGDSVITKVKKLLNYGSSDGWAVLCTSKSPKVLIHGLEAMLQVMDKYGKWKLSSNPSKKELIRYMEERRGLDHACSHVNIRVDDRDIIENLPCPECPAFMEKKILYRCCHYDDELEI